MRGLRNILFAILFSVASVGMSAASDIYVAQNAAGGNSGADCADAHGKSYLDTPGSWAAGNTYHLCGTFTAMAGSSSYITAQASGSSTNPLTLKFETGAVIQSSYWSGPVINLNGKSFIIVDGGTNGTVQATANGSSLANQQDNGICVNDGSPGGTATNITVQNLICQNIYVHSSMSDDGGGATYGFDLSNISNLVIRNNTIHDTKWATRLSFGGGTTYVGATFSGNTIYNIDHCLFQSDSSTGANVTVTNTLVYANVCHDFANWDNTSNSNHHDGFHFSSNSGSHFNGVYLYSNDIYGDIGINNTAGVFSYPDANTFTNYYVFNNVIVNGSTNHCWNNGAISLYEISPGPEYIYNNTFVSNASSCRDNGIDYSGNAASLVAENNIFQNYSGSSHAITAGTTLGVIDYNIYYLAQNWSWHGTGLSNFATWKADCACDPHSITTNALLTGLYTLGAGSSASGAGVNLNGVCNGQPNPGLGALCSDKSGVARLQSGAWDIGAYTAGGNSPDAPSGLAAQVN